MNIVKFDIEFRKQKGFLKKQKIFDLLKKRLVAKHDVKDYDTYKNQSQKRWKSLDYKNLTSPVNINDIVASSQIQNIEYFILRKSSKPVPTDRITFQVICIFNNEHVSKSINKVIRSVKRLFSDYFDITLLTNPPRENQVFMYPYKNGDIYDNRVLIKAGFQYNKFRDKPALIRNIIFLMLAIAFSVAMWFESDVIWLQRVVIALWIFLGTEALVLIFTPKYKIGIINLNSPLDHDKDINEGNEEEQLKNPN